MVLAGLVVLFMRARSKDHIDELLNKRRASSKLVTRADYMEGLERMPVALALTEDTFFYENPDFNAMFGLQMIDEIEYDDELATGRQVEHGSIALRLRSHGTTFEFILAPDVCNKWMEALPPRRADEPRVKAAV
ncbi:MAG TPA: hypothetical protein VJ901_06295 [Thermoanaerobaculia bacterium]|nr:hypothetical protein [Thermoanaerobaculia bacterium]